MTFFRPRSRGTSLIGVPALKYRLVIVVVCSAGAGCARASYDAAGVRPSGTGRGGDYFTVRSGSPDNAQFKLAERAMQSAESEHTEAPRAEQKDQSTAHGASTAARARWTRPTARGGVRDDRRTIRVDREQRPRPRSRRAEQRAKRTAPCEPAPRAVRITFNNPACATVITRRRAERIACSSIASASRTCGQRAVYGVTIERRPAEVRLERSLYKVLKQSTIVSRRTRPTPTEVPTSGVRCSISPRRRTGCAVATCDADQQADQAGVFEQARTHKREWNDRSSGGGRS